jgi:hypothetical protein
MVPEKEETEKEKIDSQKQNQEDPWDSEPPPPRYFERADKNENTENRSKKENDSG